MKNFNEWLMEKHPEMLDEDWKKWAKNAAMGASLAGASFGGGMKYSQMNQNNPTTQTQFQSPSISPIKFQSPSISPIKFQSPSISPIKFDVRKMFDDHSKKGGAITPEQWSQYAPNYGKPNAVGFVPDPNNYQKWIPANGADSMYVQDRTEINKDKLTKDQISLTPYKNGKPFGPTNTSDYAR